jgi:carbon storage regulator
MLLIRRRIGESILIGPDVEIQVVDISPTRVVVGISAPQEIPILRKEIRLAREANLEAARPVSLESLQRLVSGLHKSSSPLAPHR